MIKKLEEVKDYLESLFNFKLQRYEAACEENGGHEGSVRAAKYLAQCNLLQRELAEVCGVEVDFERHL